LYIGNFKRIKELQEASNRIIGKGFPSRMKGINSHRSSNSVINSVIQSTKREQETTEDEVIEISKPYNLQ
jgi:hypothetical protein